MDTIIESPQRGTRNVVQDLNLVDVNWSGSSQNQTLGNNNSTLLYIAVEYVKDYKIDETTPALEPHAENYNDFDHVSPLDPNMSSVARYSPVYNDSSAATVTEFNPVVIHQLITSEESNVQNDQFVSINNNNNLDNMPTVLCNNDLRSIDTQYLQMNDSNSNNIVNADNSERLLVPEREQKVELLITDEATGISYSVDAQELLVERCLDEDQQLLEALAPEPLLESDLLTLDDSTLKSELNDDIDINPPPVVVSTINDSVLVNTYADTFADSNTSKGLETTSAYNIETRKRTRTALFDEEQLLSCVYTITDKPILSRARASLPESYLVISKINGENAVFAKKAIPPRTQFGPLEGVISALDPDNLNKNLLNFLVDNDGIYRIDATDESFSNWMGFVRKAEVFEEQNLIITQENHSIYFTTITNILPKQELKVGYSVPYARHFKLPILEPKQELIWSCYECPNKFASSEELQNHWAVHDVKDENVKPRKRHSKHKKRFIFKEAEAIECNLCKDVFMQYSYNFLKNHIQQQHNVEKPTVENFFSIILRYKCEKCPVEFRSEALLKIHNLEHDPDSGDEQLNHVCPECQRKFPTQRQLVTHIMQYALAKKPVQVEKVKCPVCTKRFAHREKLQTHMLVHGSEDSKPLQCKTCNKRFLNNSALACHVKTHFVGKKVFECPICKESFDQVLKLKLHVPKHCFNNTFTCPHCMKVFKKYNIIRKHIRAFHSERTHECEHCLKVFPSYDKLKMHLLRHSDHREFLCADCGKQFKRKDKLKEHCKRIHNEERENTIPELPVKKIKKFTPKVEPTDFHRFIYKCRACLVGFKRRGMLVNHLAKRHPDIPPDSVPELNLPILQTTRDYYCQYCDKVYKSSSKRKAHILKNHPGAALPMSNRKQGSLQEVSGLPNPTFSQTVGNITTSPQSCKWCHKQYASKAKLLQHQRKKHPEQIACEISQTKDDKQVEEKGKNDPVAEIDAGADFGDKVGVANIMTDELDDYNLDEDSQLCHLSINESENFIEAGDLENPNSPNLYRLLTTNNGMLPPR